MVLLPPLLPPYDHLSRALSHLSRGQRSVRYFHHYQRRIPFHSSRPTHDLVPDVPAHQLPAFCVRQESEGR